MSNLFQKLLQRRALRLELVLATHDRKQSLLQVLPGDRGPHRAQRLCRGIRRGRRMALGLRRRRREVGEDTPVVGLLSEAVNRR